MGADNIVERLRDSAHDMGEVHHFYGTRKLMEDAAAEIVRLRGEADALRQCGIKYLGWLGVKDAENGLRKDMADPEMVDRPAPAMPNGVEDIDWPFTYIVPDSKHEYVPKHHAERKIRDALRAADNRDAAGVLREAFAKGDAPTAGYEKYWDDTPAAVPAGEAVAIPGPLPMAPRGNDQPEWDHDSENSYVQGWNDCRSAALAAHQQAAPVQAAPQEGEALPSDGAYMIVYDDQDMHPETFARNGARDAAMHRFEQISGNWNAHLYAKIRSNCRDVDVPDALAAHTSACELGAVRELVKVWRIAVNSASTTNKQDLRPERFIRELEAALQHRGDSQEVGRG